MLLHVILVLVYQYNVRLMVACTSGHKGLYSLGAIFTEISCTFHEALDKPFQKINCN